MAPEHAPGVAIVDAQFDGDSLRARLEYVEPQRPGLRLRVRWSVESQPEDFRSVGRGVAYIYEKSGGITVSTSEDARPTDLGSSRYQWTEGLQKEWPWLMFILILPENHTLANPQP